MRLIFWPYDRSGDLTLLITDFPQVSLDSPQEGRILMHSRLTTMITMFASMFVLNSQCFSVDLLYVKNAGGIFTYDVSLASATDILNSEKTFINTTLNNSGTITVDKSGNLYLSDSQTDTISKFNSAGNLTNTITRSMLPKYMAVDNLSNLYVTSGPGWNPSIDKFDSVGVFQSSIAVSAYGICIDNSGNIYGANPGSNMIFKYSPDGTSLGTIGSSSNLDSPRQPAIDGAGNLYVANYSPNISMFNSSGVFQKYIGANLPWTESMAVDSAGNLFVPNGYGSINKYDSAGNFLFSWNHPGGGTDFLAFASITVPEPSTYALAIIASSVVVMIARRRNRSQA